jgi:hypothetical protein
MYRLVVRSGDGSGDTARGVLYAVVGMARVRDDVRDPARSELVTVVWVDDYPMEKDLVAHGVLHVRNKARERVPLELLLDLQLTCL